MDESKDRIAGGSECPSYSTVIGRDLISRDIEGPSEVFHLNYKNYLPQKDRLALDLGCGTGVFLEYLAREGFTNIAGVDSDADAVGVCRGRLKEYNVRQFNAVQADIFGYLRSLESGSVPCIVMNDVIEHFPKDELVRILKEVYRVLETGGVFIARTGNIENPLNIGLFLRDFTHHIGFTTNSLFHVLIMCGFQRDKITVKPYKFAVRTIKQKIAVFSFFLVSSLLKLMAYAMRMNIRETGSLIFCVATKQLSSS